MKSKQHDHDDSSRLDDARAPFKEGDRVRHEIFGFGTVVGAAVKLASDWSIPVQLDNPSLPRVPLFFEQNVLSMASQD